MVHKSLKSSQAKSGIVLGSLVKTAVRFDLSLRSSKLGCSIIRLVRSPDKPGQESLPRNGFPDEVLPVLQEKSTSSNDWGWQVKFDFKLGSLWLACVRLDLCGVVFEKQSAVESPSTQNHTPDGTERKDCITGLLRHVTFERVKWWSSSRLCSTWVGRRYNPEYTPNMCRRRLSLSLSCE